MRKIALLFFMTLLSIVASAQIPIRGVSSYIQGYWGEWKICLPFMFAKGNYANIVLYTEGNHPSDYCVHLSIENFSAKIDKKEKKRRIKKDESYQYNGTIEFYLSETCDNVPFWVKFFGTMTPNPSFNGAHKVSYPAIIRIKPYKDNPELYMVFFNDMGIAFTF